jgi:flagellin
MRRLYIMRINNNLMSINAQRFMDRAADKQMESIGKLSSGRSINSAADNAAGLAISEKMRAQINGLEKAEANAQDGISMMQVVGGAFDETTEILQKIRTLAIQSANDTLAQSERYKIQDEVDELASEITRISNTIEFNGKKLLNGSLTSDTENGSDMNLQIGSDSGQSMSFGLQAMDAHSLGVDRRESEATVEEGAGDVVGVEVTGFSVGVVDGNVITVMTGTVEAQKSEKSGTRLEPFKTGNVGNITLDGEEVYMKFVRGIKPGEAVFDPYGYGCGGLLAERFQMDIDNIANLNGKYKVTWDNDNGYLKVATEDTGSDARIEFGDSSPPGSLDTLGLDTTPVLGSDEAYTITFSDGIRTDSVVTIAADATSVTATGDFAGLTVALDGSISNDISIISLDITSGTSTTISDDGTVNDAVVKGGLDVSTGSAAGAAINTIDDAIMAVSEERAKVGGLHNRLEHIINNLNTSSENLTASESQIRDVDMAKEMMEYTKLGILMEVSQAMMAQANKNPEEVLNLLR